MAPIPKIEGNNYLVSLIKTDGMKDQITRSVVDVRGTESYYRYDGSCLVVWNRNEAAMFYSGW